MSIRLHIIITNVLLFSLFFLSGWFLFTNEQTKDWDMFVKFLIIVATVTPVVNLVRGKLLAAKCPACGGKAYAENYRPVKYVCSSCSHVEVTNMSHGKRDYAHEIIQDKNKEQK